MTTTTHTQFDMYPCDRGYSDGKGRGLHHFVAAQYGPAVCTYCGKVVASGGYVEAPLPVPCPWGPYTPYRPYKLEEITVGDPPWPNATWTCSVHKMGFPA